MRHLLLLLPLLLAATAATAQAPAPAGPQPAPTSARALQESEQLEGRRNQKIERIRHEDAGSRIDEVRYGGQTQSIVVQPKADVPEYEVQAAPLSRTRPADSREGLSSAGGQRFWNVLRF
ncbi:hypothetical protein [Ramlibacter tataouinensis]|nr:hypothetical protein [Ramlibacter tataouinensis]